MDDVGEGWPDECPACTGAIEQHPKTLSWVCSECGMDEEGLESLAEDRATERAVERMKGVW